jgi:hypothetical protein
MEKSKFSFELTSTDPVAELGFEAWIDNQCVTNIDHVMETITVNGFLPSDDESEHVLKMVLKGKKSNHTTVDSNGNIISDALLKITNLTFDDIQLGTIFTEQAVYYHDFNGTQSAVEDKFFDCMGCNGTVELKFFTPIYLWFLENM